MSAGIFIIQAALFAVLSAIIASEKNRNPVKWGAVGALFSLIGLIVTLTLSEGEPGGQSSTNSHGKGQPASEENFDPDSHEKKCPDCAEYIKLEAQVCKHCGHEFSGEEVSEQIAKARENFKEKRRAAEQDKAQDEVEKASVKEDMTVLGIIVLVIGAVALLVTLTSG